MTVFIDTNVLVYLSQPNSEFFEHAANLLLVADKSKYTLACSVFAWAEYAVYRESDGLEMKVDDLFSSGIIKEFTFGHNEANEYARLRKKLGKAIKSVDAIHIAAALTAKAKVFITNDLDLLKLKIVGIQIIPLTSFSDDLLMSESALKNWNTPEEDKAWKDLQ